MKKTKIELNRKLILQKDIVGKLNDHQSGNVKGGDDSYPACGPTYRCVLSNGQSFLPQAPCCVEPLPTGQDITCRVIC